MKRRYSLFGWTAIACLLSILVSCTQQPQTPIRLGAVLWPGYEPLFLARDLGYYKEQAIELQDYPSGTEVNQAVRDGDIEVAALTMDEALLLAETIPDIQVVLVTDFSNGADVLMATPTISTLKDLKGHRIGVESSSLGGYVISRVLDKAGLSLQDVQIASMGVSEHEEAFKQKLVDAVVTFEPVRSNLLKAGATILFDSSQIPGEIIDVLVVRQGVLKTHKATLEKLVQGWFRALEYQKQNPQDAAKRMASREQVTAEQFIESLKLIQVPDLQTNLELLGKTGSSLQDNVKRLGKFMLDKKLLEQPISINQLFNNNLVKTAQSIDGQV